MKIVSVTTHDVRFPTSRELDGSDAMNPDPDYSAAYVVPGTDSGVTDLGDFARRLTHDSQMRWLGPEKGVMQLAAAAIINAAWDVVAKAAGMPVWRFLAQMSPQAIVDVVDWRYLSDALTPGEALDVLKAVEPGRDERIALRRPGSGRASPLPAAAGARLLLSDPAAIPCPLCVSGRSRMA